jgi:hypothetical protein
MLLKIILISVVLLAIAFMGFGIKLFFDKDAKLPSGSCEAANSSGEGFGCGCGAGHCAGEKVSG